jgi:hypothetical protein
VSIAPLPPDQVCAPQGEPNNTLATSLPLAPLLEQGASLERCPSTDIDFYSFEVAAQAEFTLCLEPGPQVPPGTNFSLTLYQTDGTALATELGLAPCLTQPATSEGQGYLMRAFSTNRDARKLAYQVTLEQTATP